MELKNNNTNVYTLTYISDSFIVNFTTNLTKTKETYLLNDHYRYYKLLCVCACMRAHVRVYMVIMVQRNKMHKYSENFFLYEK